MPNQAETSIQGEDPTMAAVLTRKTPPKASTDELDEPTRRELLGVFAGLAAGITALGAGILTPPPAEAAPKKLGGRPLHRTKPEQPDTAEETVEWAQEVLKQVRLETREEQIAFCERWLALLGEEAALYLPANIGRFFEEEVGYSRFTPQDKEVTRLKSYLDVRKDYITKGSRVIQSYTSDTARETEIKKSPDPDLPLGHEFNIEVMQIELARFCLKYEAELKTGDREAIEARKPNIPGFYPLELDNVPSKEALRKLDDSEVFAAFGLSHPGSRRLFVEALQEGLRLRGDKEGVLQFTELMTGNARQCTALGCEKIIDDEVARFLVLNRDALLEEPIDFNKLRTPLL